MCVVGKNSNTPNLSPMADGAITRGGIRRLGSPLYICGKTQVTAIMSFGTINCFRVSFKADMMDDSDIKHHDIVPGAAIQLEVWYTWKTLIKAAADGEIDQVMTR